jgi:hypothetical protein
MKRVRLLILFLLAFGASQPHPLQADDNDRGKLGFDIKGFKPNLRPDIGWITGGRWARYFGSSQVYMGLGAYFGAPTGLSIKEEYLAYGGLTLGVDKKVGKIGVFEGSVLLGYGQGQMKQFSVNETSNLVVEPTVGFGGMLGGGWRMTFAVSYLHMASAKNFSGPSFGVRFQFRSSSSLKASND